VLTPDGQILDGRTRAKICSGLGIDMNSRVASFDEMLDPTALVLSLNAARRHLTADQIAALYLSRPVIEPPREALTRSPRGEGKTSGKTAKKIGVSRATFERVQQIQKVAPEKMAEVASGKISAKKVVHAARAKHLAQQRYEELAPGRAQQAEREQHIATLKADPKWKSLSYIAQQAAIEKQPAPTPEAEAEWEQLMVGQLGDAIESLERQVDKIVEQKPRLTSEHRAMLQGIVARITATIGETPNDYGLIVADSDDEGYYLDEAQSKAEYEQEQADRATCRRETIAYLEALPASEREYEEGGAPITLATKHSRAMVKKFHGQPWYMRMLRRQVDETSLFEGAALHVLCDHVPRNIDADLMSLRKRIGKKVSRGTKA
jgi:hypothetical protein